MKKLLAVVLAGLFMTGSAGLALSEEQKTGDKAKTEKAADAKEVKKSVMKSKSARGTVKTAAADSVVVAGKDGTEWTFALDDKTSVRKAGKAITGADIKSGDPVDVTYMEHDGKAVALKVTVKGAKMSKSEGQNPCAAKNPCAGKKQ